jgi:hypothetical protein
MVYPFAKGECLPGVNDTSCAQSLRKHPFSLPSTAPLFAGEGLLGVQLVGSHKNVKTNCFLIDYNENIEIRSGRPADVRMTLYFGGCGLIMARRSKKCRRNIQRMNVWGLQVLIMGKA